MTNNSTRFLSSFDVFNISIVKDLIFCAFKATKMNVMINSHLALLCLKSLLRNQVF